MNLFAFNNDSASNASADTDVLSVFKQKAEKSTTIHQGMTTREISDIVSDKVISIVLKQFEIVKQDFQTNKK